MTISFHLSSSPDAGQYKKARADSTPRRPESVFTKQLDEKQPRHAYMIPCSAGQGNREESKMRLEERAERKVAAAYGLTREGSHDEHFLDKYLADAHEWYEKECIVNYYARTSHPKKREKLEKVLDAIDDEYFANAEDEDRIISTEEWIEQEKEKTRPRHAGEHYK